MLQGYTQIKLLGHGSFGKAHLVKHTQTGQLLVAKTIDLHGMSPEEQLKVLKEVEILGKLNHPNIIRLKKAVVQNATLYILMEYAENGDLSTYISQHKKGSKEIKQQQILDWMIQLCQGVAEIHKRKIVHRDLKVQNIFVGSDNVLKVGDFGISTVLNNTNDKAMTVIGSPYSISPEVINNQPYSFKADIWSLGTIMYELCTLERPFQGNSIQSIAFKIVKGEYKPITRDLSVQLRCIVESMLQVNPSSRPQTWEVLQRPGIVGKKIEIQRLKLKQRQQQMEVIRREQMLNKVQRRHSTREEEIHIPSKIKKQKMVQSQQPKGDLKRPHLPLQRVEVREDPQNSKQGETGTPKMSREQSQQDIISKLKRSRTINKSVVKPVDKGPSNSTQRKGSFRSQHTKITELPYEIVHGDDVHNRNTKKYTIPLHLSLNNFNANYLTREKETKDELVDQSMMENLRIDIEEALGIDLLLKLYKLYEAESTIAKDKQAGISRHLGKDQQLLYQKHGQQFKDLIQMQNRFNRG